MGHFSLPLLRNKWNSISIIPELLRLFCDRQQQKQDLENMFPYFDMSVREKQLEISFMLRSGVSRNKIAAKVREMEASDPTTTISTVPQRKHNVENTIGEAYRQNDPDLLDILNGPEMFTPAYMMSHCPAGSLFGQQGGLRPYLKRPVFAKLGKALIRAQRTGTDSVCRDLADKAMVFLERRCKQTKMDRVRMDYYLRDVFSKLLNFSSTRDEYLEMVGLLFKWRVPFMYPLC